MLRPGAFMSQESEAQKRYGDIPMVGGTTVWMVFGAEWG